VEIRAANSCRALSVVFLNVFHYSLTVLIFLGPLRPPKAGVLHGLRSPPQPVALRALLFSDAHRVFLAGSPSAEGRFNSIDLTNFSRY